NYCIVVAHGEIFLVCLEHLAMLKTAEESTPCAMSTKIKPDSRGLDPAIHHLRKKTFSMDARAFAGPKGLRPRRRVKPAHDEWCLRSGVRDIGSGRAAQQTAVAAA
ncbi:MAG TPA: hypothetical protein VKR55_08000, partial [Bradyrhizobium sp.]|nr:hypothetical protein [Bradyrhizobium sp.]